jgi:hypothetical protein
MMSYSEDWSFNYHAAKNPLSAEEAARRHSARRRYAVASGAIDSPDAVILMTGNSALIEFFDDNRDDYLSLQFQEKRPGELFLSMATYRKFRGGEKPISAVTFTFEEDGSGRIVEYDGATKGTKVRTVAPANVSLNWEPYPQFGQYEGLLRVERS